MTSVLTPDYLKELFSYSLTTGLFRRRVCRNRHSVGTVAGTINSKGYVVIGIDGTYYKAHRLAWLYVYGSWPLGEIDHINRQKTDNRISNLRQSSRRQNTQNIGAARCTNRLGYLGVSPSGDRFIARICVGGRQLYLGTFTTVEGAHRAYTKAKEEHHV